MDDRTHHHDHHAHGHPPGLHRHHHVDLHGPSPERRLGAALALTVGFMVVEVVAGWLVHSLALVSDAGHMLADSGALGLALVAQRVATRPRTTWKTYGFRRAETLAALANGVALGLTALWVVVTAVARLQTPTPILAEPMLAVAAVGLLVNLVSGWLLARGGAHNANTRAALAHVVADAFGSVAAIAAALLVIAFGWTRADAVASLAISALILWGAVSLVNQTVSVLMEGVPPGVVLAELDETIRATRGVADVHDLHAWSISDGFDAVTVHVVLDGNAHGTDVAKEVGERIQRIHKVAHVTVQPEAPSTAPLRPAETLLRKGKS